jgi:hypothetical protein
MFIAISWTPNYLRIITIPLVIQLKQWQIISSKVLLEGNYAYGA